MLRLVTRMNVGGPARHALLLTRGLGAEFATTLAAGTPAESEGELSDPAVPVTRVPLVRSIDPPSDVRALLAVRRLLKAGRPALLHTHMAKAGTVGRLAAGTTCPRVRTVHTFHGHVLQGYFGTVAQRAFTEAERALARRTDVLVAVSAEIRDELLELGIGRPEQFHVIPVGLELDPFLSVRGPTGRLRTRLGVPAGTPLVGAVGRLVPIKDHLTMLRAVARLPGVHLALIGDGELRAQVQARAHELGIAERVHVTGWVADVPEAVGDLDAVVLTSRNEGTPVALIEAAAAGRPAVATRVGGVESVVVDGATGHLAPPADPDRIAALLGKLLDDPAAAARMGRAARERVRKRFGSERLLRDIRDLYADLLGTRVGVSR